MLKRSLSALLVVVASACEVDAQILSIDGASLEIRVIPGFCNDQDPTLLTPLAKVAVNRRPIALSAPCADLAEFKSGRLDALPKYIAWSIETTDAGAAFKIPLSITREEFADGIAKSAPNFDLSHFLAEANDKLRQQGFSAVDMKSPGIIDRDTAAVYFATVLRQGDSPTSKVVAGVIGMAAIRHFSLGIYAYEELKDSSTYTDLLSMVKPLTQAALQDNPD